MTLSRLKMLLDFPLLTRELTESSYRRRTYVLRCIISAFMMLVLFSSYQVYSTGANSVLIILGRGVELAGALLYFCLWTIYLLLPAMSCSAVSSEREKQTLGLILISRVSPMGLVFEKFLGRLLPMIAMLSLTAPLLGIAYAMGGFSVEGIISTVLVLFVACLQVISTGIFWSSLLKTSMQSFWCSYLTLLAMILVPTCLYWQDLLPVNGILFGFQGGETCFVFYMFMYYGAEVMTGRVTLEGFLFSCLPPVLFSLMMIVVSGMAISRWRMEAPFGASGSVLFRNAGLWCFQIPIKFFRTWFSGSRSGDPQNISATGQDRMPRKLPATQGIAWREMRRTPLTRLPGQITVVLLIIGSLIWLAQPDYFIRPPANVAIVHFCLMLISALLMASVCSRTFTSERERETLDLLLTTPLTNQELLREKLAAATRIRTFLMLVFSTLVILRLLYADSTMSYENGPARYPMGHIGYAVTSLLYTYLHLTFCKWTAVMFSLMLKTQMRAMIASILVILGVCFGTLMGTAILMSLLNIRDDGSFLNPAIFSPFFVYLSNEVQELHRMSRDVSPMVIVTVNLLGYGGFVAALATVVRLRAGEWLQRTDDE